MIADAERLRRRPGARLENSPIENTLARSVRTAKPLKTCEKTIAAWVMVIAWW